MQPYGVATSRSFHVARRLAWAGLLIAHGYWFAKSLLSPASATSSPVLLGLALAFFTLKVVDVRWLRVPGHRRAIVCFALVVVLLHSQVLAPILPHDASMAWLALPAEVVTVIAVRVAVVLFVYRLLWRLARTRLSSALARLDASQSWAGFIHQRERTLVATPLRGPPAGRL